MKPCTLITKNGIPDWCASGCERYHHGHHRKYALGTDELSIGYRIRWAQLAIAASSLPVEEKYVPYTIAQAIENYALTLAEHVATGRRMVPLPVYQERRETCNQCDMRDPDKDACRICKCKLSPTEWEALLIGDKLKWAVAECPANKWKKWHTDTVIESRSVGDHGVVIGSYGMPGVVELSIAMIRKTCGHSVPILIADDNTPEKMGRKRLLELPRKWPSVSLIMNGENLGHAPGDIRAYRNGLRWAKANHIKYLCKLSQRFIFTSENWLKTACDMMQSMGVAVASQRAVHLNLQFAIRSECVFMDVDKCTSSEVMMSRLDPAEGKIPTSAEDWLAAAINEGGLGPVQRCAILPVDRFGKHPNAIWHNSHSTDNYNEVENAYTRLAKEMGIDLGPEFSGAGWHVIAAHRPEAKYHML